MVHHDLWDYDTAAQPALVTVTHDGRRVPAVAQATKMGAIFLLDRETGKPLFRSRSGRRRRPTSPERPAADAALPRKPRSIMPTGPLTPADAWGMNGEGSRGVRRADDAVSVEGDLHAAESAGHYDVSR